MEKEIFSAKKKKGEKRMHKEWIICTVVIIAIIIANVITQNYTNKSIELLDEKLESLKEELIKEEVEKEVVDKKMEEIMEIWKEKFNKLAYYIEHDELEKVETELTSLKANIEVEEYEEGVSELEKSIFILNHIKEKFKFDIKNIF